MYFKRILRRRHWELLKKELVDTFSKHSRDTSITLEVLPWPKFVQKEQLLSEGLVPALITDFGPLRKICIKSHLIHKLAFDEPYAHLSHLFTGRLYNLFVKNEGQGQHSDGGVLEKCIISEVNSDPVEKVLYFIKFKRHVEGRITEVNIPCTITGLFASPAYLKGYHVELMMPTIKCEVVGKTIPPPFQIDVSSLEYNYPFSSIYLRDILHLLPSDESVLFHRDYDLDTQEVVCTYLPGSLPEQPLPADYIDPNFINKKGKRIHLTYKGYWPKQ
ncbi:uncharacterized protein TA13025 [Theileria annulata]|uniref:Ribosomal protein L25 n=1 Tax=Theileria annulata TaxID=5874 RepID=Q4UDB4_THEAN|nr:uncharacterized protein TA13025 [Theileria annulata]CAI74925.1 hypothetical protein, conserved [Theileria annulata]|eukprot:XP_952657.1 hypothetical protein, conserved [Theileria annulata]